MGEVPFKTEGSETKSDSRQNRCCQNGCGPPEAQGPPYTTTSSLGPSASTAPFEVASGVIPLFRCQCQQFWGMEKYRSRSINCSKTLMQVTNTTVTLGNTIMLQVNFIIIVSLLSFFLVSTVFRVSCCSYLLFYICLSVRTLMCRR